MDKISAKNLVSECEIELKDQYARLEDIALYNQKKVLDAYKNQSIQARHMFGTTGYGYDDIGRDTESALVFKRSHPTFSTPKARLFLRISYREHTL